MPESAFDDFKEYDKQVFIGSNNDEPLASIYPQESSDSVKLGNLDEMTYQSVHLKISSQENPECLNVETVDKLSWA